MSRYLEVEIIADGFQWNNLHDNSNDDVYPLCRTLDSY